ncbi:Rv0361 family membrane protein [Nocardia terpenica]|uniref:DUF4878 domain-containing protein n=1 Tax=Nocardia terpenica TaxID=455432 RepID=A0A291RUV9_9NOCA|nr:hypothetical protein [Nocardia terpenica]ATL71080.1 hypothetical protein CRH09_37810 [Nocardia terpenica]
MSDAADGPTPATPIDQREATRSALPFLIAAVIAVLVVIAVIAMALLRPAENNVTQADRIAAAVKNFAAAQAESDPARRASAACAGFDPAKSPLGPGAAGKKVDITGLTDPAIDGDRAKATVTSEVDGRKTTATWNLTRADGKTWLVCN